MDTLFIDVDGGYKKLDHVAVLNQLVLFGNFFVLGKLRKLNLGVRLVLTLVDWLYVLLCGLRLLQSKIVPDIHAGIKEVRIINWEGRLNHSQRRQLRSVHREKSPSLNKVILVA
jgi:hypothetical protein